MTEEEQQAAPISRKTWLVGGGIGAIAAAAVVVVFVLPAEYGIDPTGLGAAMGLTAINDPGMSPEQKRGALRTGVLTLSDDPFVVAADQPSDHWEYELAPFTSIEFKYTLAEGAAMEFDWSATGSLHYDMHAHPFDGGTDLTESYSVGDASHMRGRYVAPFSGIHGWYWQNRTSDNVTLTLKASGAMTESTLFGQFGESKRPIEPIE